MLFDKIDNKSTNNNNDYTNPSFAERLVIPTLFVIAYIGGWVGCGIWYGHYFP